MKSLIISLFGSYNPPVYEYYYGSGNNSHYSIIPDGMAGVDWQYVLGVLLFGIVLYCVLKMIGAFISNA